MGLKDKAYENCKKWYKVLPACKENWRWGSNVFRCTFFVRLSNGSPTVKLLWALDFLSDFLTLAFSV